MGFVKISGIKQICKSIMKQDEAKSSTDNTLPTHCGAQCVMRTQKKRCAALTENAAIASGVSMRP